MAAVPALTPVTIPVAEPAVAVPVDTELHEPPPVISLRMVTPPLSQTVAGPVIGAGVVGNGLTVITTAAAVLPQLFASV